MLRPLDQALIDYQKTYRLIYKEPLIEHEQYTKRQLIYSYGAIGSNFIHQVIQKNINPSVQNQEVDIDQLIKQWNNPNIKVQDMMNQKNEKGQQIIEQIDEEETSFKRDIEVLKKEKLVLKTRLQRNINFRKEFQILFKAKNVNMISVQSLRNHFSDLKPTLTFNSRYRSSKSNDRYSSDKPNQEYNRDNNYYNRKSFQHQYDKNYQTKQLYQRRQSYQKRGSYYQGKQSYYLDHSGQRRQPYGHMKESYSQNYLFKSQQHMQSNPDMNQGYQLGKIDYKGEYGAKSEYNQGGYSNRITYPQINQMANFIPPPPPPPPKDTFIKPPSQLFKSYSSQN